MEPIEFEFKKVKLLFHPNTLNGFYYTPVILLMNNQKKSFI